MFFFVVLVLGDFPYKNPKFIGNWWFLLSLNFYLHNIASDDCKGESFSSFFPSSLQFLHNNIFMIDYFINAYFNTF